MENKISVSKILNEWFNIYLSNFIKICLPMLIYSTFYYLVLDKMPQVTQGYGPEVIQGYTNIGFVINLVTNTYITCVIINIVSSHYTGINKEYIEYFKIPISTVIGMIVVSFIITIGMAAGMLLLIVPGILAALGWVVVKVVYINEDDENPISSIGRSWELTKGNKGQILGLQLVIIILLVIFVFAMFYLIQGSMISFSSIADGSYVDFASNSIYLILNSSIFIPMFTSLSVVIYFNLRKIKEGFDVEQLSNNFMDGDNE